MQTFNKIREIEIETLERAGVSSENAEKLVDMAIKQVKDWGIKQPSRVPFSP